MIRRLVERLSRNSAFRRRLPSAFGGRPVYLSGDSALSYLKPDWAKASASLLNAAAKYAAGAKCVWDIGSNCGVFAIAAAHVAGPNAEILAIEPDPFLATLLQKSARDQQNSDRTIHVLCSAVSDREGLARFLIANRGRSSNALEQSGGRCQSGGTRYVQHVPTITLDALLSHFPRPDMIKIDVEGAETLVLQGATELLRKARPVIYIEVGAEQNADVTRELRHHDYRLFDGDGDCSKPLDRCAFNTLAVPAESQRRYA